MTKAPNGAWTQVVYVDKKNGRINDQCVHLQTLAVGSRMLIKD